MPAYPSSLRLIENIREDLQRALLELNRGNLAGCRADLEYLQQEANDLQKALETLVFGPAAMHTPNS
jgi:hypothetical protein